MPSQAFGKGFFRCSGRGHRRMKTFLAALRRKSSPAQPTVEEGWHSWDPHPWRHPWLSSSNLRTMREFSRFVLAEERKAAAGIDPKSLKLAFCGNIANSMYVRARPLRRAGMNIDIILHPQDDFVLSHPAWEEFDGIIDADAVMLAELERRGISLPEVADVYRYPQTGDWRSVDAKQLSFLRPEDIVEYSSYLTSIDTLLALQSKDALWCAQAPYLGYLANRPYVVSQTGGDIWFEASRNDQLGQLQRRSFGKGRLFLVSNPWSFAHARRFGFQNLIYLPMILDQVQYSPGHGTARERWEASGGGSFFVLSTSRLDENDKGSSLALEGFAEFSRRCPEARLVTVGWGTDASRAHDMARSLGISGKIIWLPLSGKEKLRDCLRSADCFIDQFVLGYFGAAGLEAMACGLPVIGRVESEQYEALCETGAPPILQAETGEQVARQLELLHADPDVRRGISERTRRWFVENHGSDRWIPEYQAVLSATARNLVPPLHDTPLNAPLSEAEENYHLSGLRCAPPFPQYKWR